MVFYRNYLFDQPEGLQHQSVRHCELCSAVSASTDSHDGSYWLIFFILYERL